VPKQTQADPTTTTDDSEEWQTLQTGSLGEEWDFRAGPLDGNYLGSRTVETEKVEAGFAVAHQFAPRSNPDAIVFLWESADLKGPFSELGDGTVLIRVGDRVRISYLGEREFTGQDAEGKPAPRRIKQYRVQVPKNIDART